MRSVTVQFLKYPDIPHWGFEAVWLGEDEWGAWVSVPTGSTRWKGEEPRRPTRNDAVFCAPREHWWHLHYNGESREYTHFVDIVTPPVWVSDDRYEMVDLDLDVVIDGEGMVEVQDEDEFAVHQVRFGYTSEMVDRARRETRRVVASLQTGAEPFFNVAQEWLLRARGDRSM